MKIRIIDLLNMISKGEELPKAIFYRERYELYKGNRYGATNRFADLIDEITWENLNDEVEIIDSLGEYAPKKIEKMKVGYLDKKVYIDNLIYNLRNMNCYEIDIIKKLNEIIDCINGE